MKSALILLLSPLFVIGVFGESVSVSVKEGKSQTLNTGITIQGSDEIEWSFNDQVMFRISKITVSDQTNGAFRGRLEVNKQTGDLKITNIKTTDSGQYTLNIISSTKGSSEKIFNVDVVKAHNETDEGVFGESVSVSVKEGKSQTLYTGITIQGSDEIEWSFNDQVMFRIGSVAGKITVSDQTEGTFGGRLEVDKQTGDLKITNIKTTDSGQYTLKINSTKGSSEKIFIVNVVQAHDETNEGVFGESVSVPVKEGKSQTLYTGITIQGSDEIEWSFNDQVMFRISKITVSDQTNGAFGGRLEVNKQTGDLKITNIKTTDSGQYKLNVISSTKGSSDKIFNVNVFQAQHDETDKVEPDPGLSSGVTAGIVIAVLAAVAAAVGGIYYGYGKKGQMYSST